MEPFQRVGRDGLMEGFSKGSSSKPAPLFLTSSFSFASLPLSERDPKGARILLFLAGLGSLGFHCNGRPFLTCWGRPALGRLLLSGRWKSNGKSYWMYSTLCSTRMWI